ncbi:MAG: single-stranded DNA-binding protein [Clostridiales bacterium]|nr:single-stranded DNA-binding protein [Clostridiales bacterium]
MNKVILMGRLTRDSETRYSQGSDSQEQMEVSRYTLAVDRRTRKGEQQTADFIQCVAFGKNGEFAEKYLRKGTKVAVTGRIQTGSYTNREGQKVYTTDVVVEEQEFAESKRAAGQQDNNAGYSDAGDGFMNIPDGIDEELPFS